MTTILVITITTAIINDNNKVSWLETSGNGLRRRLAFEAFRTFDADNSGKIDVVEMVGMCPGPPIVGCLISW